MTHRQTLSYLTLLFSVVFVNFIYAKQIAISKDTGIFDVEYLNDFNNSLQIVYPQILIITDRKFRSMFSNEWEESKYVVSYWKRVNEAFSKLTHPRVMLHISGIVQMDNFAKENIFLTKRRKSLFRRLNPLNLEFDVAVVMSGEDSLSTSLPGPLGYSINGSACNFPNNLAAVIDDGQYRTVFLAAHELAHTFSAQHDGSFDSSNDCYADEKNIMSVTFYENDSKEFSICSLQKMQEFFNSKGASCLYNKPSPK